MIFWNSKYQESDSNINHIIWHIIQKISFLFYRMSVRQIVHQLDSDDFMAVLHSAIATKTATIWNSL